MELLSKKIAMMILTALFASTNLVAETPNEMPIINEHSSVYADILDSDIKKIIEPEIEVQVCEFTPVEEYTEQQQEVEIIVEEDSYMDNTYTEYEIYELAKIIMCEAEGESQKCKEYIGQVVVNRVNSNKFPNTMHDVIFQDIQFTPTFNGRWEKVEPNEACYEAAYTVINAAEPITDALYFEACKGESWHSRNLIKVAEIDNTRFYIE